VDTANDNIVLTRCCIAGGGPAGMMLGLLLARAGVDVIVLEKHADFFRDFRGDTVHPSTLQVMDELGLLDAFLQRPHDKARTLQVHIAGRDLTIADFTHLRGRCNYIAMMPQWEFLDFLRDQAAFHQNFQLVTNAEVIGLLQTNDIVQGVQVRTTEGVFQIHADLVVGADGRHSTVRKAADLTVRDIGAPIDVLWMRLPVAAGDPDTTGGRIGSGQFLVMIHRGDYWQCAYVIPKGGIDDFRARGLLSFQQELVSVAPMLADRVALLDNWDDIKLLSVTVDRLERWWKPGLLCIGDAAHAMSPIGGVGINLAIQDAVATANLLSDALANPNVSAEQITAQLHSVQRRRLLPARLTQSVQVAIQNRLLTPFISTRSEATSIPWPLKLMDRWPVLRRIPAYAIGIGVRPEHVRAANPRQQFLK